MTSINCRVRPSWQHKRDPCGPRGDPQFDMPALHYLGSSLIWCKASTVLVVYGSDCQVLLQTIFTSTTKRNEAKRFKLLASLIPVFVMFHILLHTHISKYIPSTYLIMEVPSIKNVLMYVKCNGWKMTCDINWSRMSMETRLKFNTYPANVEYKVSSQ
jgi:hypothetical protein